jgi:hypothetical protein
MDKGEECPGGLRSLVEMRFLECTDCPIIRRRVRVMIAKWRYLRGKFPSLFCVV